jgi:hypothetical protein
MFMAKPTREELLEASWGDDENFKILVDKVTGTSRHGTFNIYIFHRVSDNTFWQVNYEIQSNGEYHSLREDGGYCEINEVEQYQKIITAYRIKK